ncbi:amidohydrolase 2 [Kwoniella heveanensis BCC8398]|uniref:Amidohydrolase 2 n=1 Tax=Kwoniella heveanensis BCC8398 TaxID=1296120 RepID=A0A1B9GJA1_9TREE|nr:amidohydrolase 2 [Kwoniella heveanensis BCC8398]
MPSLASTASIDHSITPEQDRICPRGSWDVHHHIFDLDKFPLSPTRHFTPSPASLASFESFQHSLGIEHPCIAHGLSFGTDPSSLLHYLKYFDGTARAYACIDIETASDEEIQNLKAQGVSGIRIDYHLHKAQHDLQRQIECIKRYSDRVTPFGWGLQIYHPHPEFYDALTPIISSLSVSLVVDHFAGLKTASLLTYQGIDASDFDAATQPGLQSICDLLRSNKLWIKLSAPYRCSEDTTYQDMKPLVRALVDANPDRVLYGSDWPHTQPFHRRPKDLKGEDVESFVEFDDMAWLKTLKSWLTSEEWEKFMVHNPRRFTGYDRND